jgi:hypothetical protein
LLKGATRFEDVILPVGQKRIPIATHTVIAYLSKPNLSGTLVGNQHASLLQDADLAGKRLYLFIVRYSLHLRHKKRLTLSALFYGKRGKLVGCKDTQ